jgi:hypothetical protein
VPEIDRQDATDATTTGFNARAQRRNVARAERALFLVFCALASVAPRRLDLAVGCDHARPARVNARSARTFRCRGDRPPRRHRRHDHRVQRQGAATKRRSRRARSPFCFLRPGVGGASAVGFGRGVRPRATRARQRPKRADVSLPRRPTAKTPQTPRPPGSTPGRSDETSLEESARSLLFSAPWRRWRLGG